MYKSWRTEASGIIVVTLADGTEKIPSLTTQAHIDTMRRIQGMATYRGRSFDIGASTTTVSTKWGLRVEWIRSMVFQESGGNPYARNPEKLPGPEDDGVGLLQITNLGLKAGYTDAQLEDPETNLNIGCRYIVRSLMARYGDNFPKISASFNAGSVHPPLKGYENEWNMHCTRGHIDSEVAALNWQILDVMDAAQKAYALQFPLLDLLNGEAPSPEAPTDSADEPPPASA